MLSEAETRLFQLVLGPGYIKEAALEHGGGDVIVGSPGAWKEAKDLADTIIRNSSSSESEQKEIGWMFNLAKEVHDISPIPDQTFWQRGLARACAPSSGDPWEIFGQCEIEISGWFRSQKNLSLMMYFFVVVLGRLLQQTPSLNRAVLDNRLWQRSSVEFLIPINFARDDLSCVVIRPEDTFQGVRKASLRAIRKMKCIRKHFMAPVFEHLWYQWSAVGYISSPASIQLSDVSGTGITHPYPSFVQGNGIPLSVVYGDLTKNSSLMVGIAGDHRALNPDLIGIVHNELRSEIPTMIATYGKDTVV